jgi:hypothetical protein
MITASLPRHVCCAVLSWPPPPLASRNHGRCHPAFSTSPAASPTITGICLARPNARSLDALNRELREAERQFRESETTPRSAQPPTAVGGPWIDSAKSCADCPRLLRVDLSKHPRRLARGSGRATGRHRRLVVRGGHRGEGLSFSASGADLAQPRGESSRVDRGSGCSWHHLRRGGSRASAGRSDHAATRVQPSRASRRCPCRSR